MITITAPPALKVAGLRKSFGEQTVLAGSTSTSPKGRPFSLLGPNGRKTTTVQILSTLLDR